MPNNNTANPFETGDDEIERFALEECIKRQRVDHRVAVMVWPAARCELAINFAKLGARVTGQWVYQRNPLRRAGVTQHPR